MSDFAIFLLAIQLNSAIFLRLYEGRHSSPTKPVIIVGICNSCHPFYTGQQKFVDTAGRVDKFQQRMVKTQAAQAAVAAKKKKK